MLRTFASRPLLAIAVAAIWTAAMIGFAISKETPVGSLKGRVMATDTGNPIAGASVWINRMEGDEAVDSFSAETDEKGNFSFKNIQAGTYEIEASAKVHSIPKSKIVIPEGKMESLDLEMEPGNPYLNIYANQHTFTTKETPSIVLDGFTKGDTVLVKLLKVNEDKLMAGQAGRARAVIMDDSYGSQRAIAANDPAIEKSLVRMVEITKRDSEGIYHQTEILNDLPAGVYIISATTDHADSTSWVSVSDLSLVLKDSGDEMLTYAVRPDSGDAISGAAVKIFQGDKPVADGVTDADGLWRTKFPVTEGAPPDRLILARQGDSITFVNSASYEEASNPVSIYAYTDRPIYRPGHMVHFKGIVRKFDHDTYHAPESGEARVEVMDKRNTLIYSATLPLSHYGSFNGSFKLPVYAATGSYDISCTYQGRTEVTNFSVAEYRKPEFEATVEMPKKRCTRGETIRAKVRANYFFGAPVVGAEVHYTISHSDYWFWPEDEEYSSEYGSDYEGEYEDYGGYGESTSEGVVRTGPDGTAVIEFQAYWKQPKDSFNDTDQQFTISADVMDSSGRDATAEGSIIGTQGNYKLSVEPDEYVADVGKDAKCSVLVVDYDGKPQRGVEVDVSANQTKWEDDEEQRIQVAESRVTTDSAGKATFTFRPREAGSYSLRATCQDRDGNTIKSQGYLWVPGEGDFRGYKYPDLQIVLDKKTYDPGDTAKVLINSSETGSTALLTVEGRRIYDYKLVKLAGKTTVVEIPIKPEYKPNFYIEVCYVKNKRFISQEARAKVSMKHETLKLTVTPDKKTYEPGEAATYLVKAVDGQGRPAQAEVSLGVVDEAIYDIEEDSTTPINQFFYSRQSNRVSTRYSFPEVYLSGDKAGFTGKVRKEFLDTAYWKADLVTDANGEARASVKLPDNLTTWRATARACTMDTAVGECTSKIVVSKKLLVRLETPRYVVQGDECVISAIVHNYLPDAQRVRVALKAPGLKIDGTVERIVTIDSQGVQKVDWMVSAPNIGNVAITAYAVAPKAQDAMQLTIPVRPHGQRLTGNATGVVTNRSATEELIVRGDSVPGANEMRIRLAPSLASSMLGSLDYLAQYPYGCTEQTMSTFLPDVVIWKTLKSLNVSNPNLEKQLPDMVGKGLNRLYDLQNEDGGWGWCHYSSQDLWMTSYVVYGLATAKSAGFSVNEDALDNGINAMQQMLNNENKNWIDPHSRIYGIYVLSVAGRADDAKERLKEVLKPQMSDPENLALVTMTLANTGQTELAKKYLAQLWDKAIVTGGDIHWETRDRWYTPATESTALAMMAVVQLTPDDPRLPKVARWLMGRRVYDHWESTRDTANVLYALSGYLKHSKELHPNETAMVYVNRRNVGSFKLDEASVFQPEKEIVIPSRDIREGRNTVRIESSGEGMVYYTAELTQFVQRPLTQQIVTGSGITITREYHKLTSQWDENARTYRLQPSKDSDTDFEIGDIIQVRLVVNSPQVFDRLLVEDYLPAGFEAYDRGSVEMWEWTYWYSDMDVRDERVSFYVDQLQKGKNVLEYQVRATTQGTFHALPTLVQAMYQPSITASGVETTVRISD